MDWRAQQEEGGGGMGGVVAWRLRVLVLLLTVLGDVGCACQRRWVLSERERKRDGMTERDREIER